MKRYIALVLLVIYITPIAVFHQLLKLPYLIEHFVEHKEENSNLTFLSFLKMHYDDDNIKYADYEKDRKLPFKSHQSSVNVGFVVFMDYEKLELNFNSVFKEPTTKNFYTKKPFKSSYLSSIWQPPKSC